MKHGIELYGVHYRDAVEPAREFRQAPTQSEAILWDALRAKRLSGLKFRRQHPVGPFFLDFYCPEHRLAVRWTDRFTNCTPGGTRYDSA